MAIILFPTLKQGKGDILFMIRIAEAITADARILPSVIIVSEHRDTIFNMHELNLPVLTPEEFQEKIKANEITPTLLIQGPTYFSGRKFLPPLSTPILFLTEYSAREERFLVDTVSLVKQAKYQGYHAESLESGFCTNSLLSPNLRFMHKINQEFGILIDKELLDYRQAEIDNLNEYRQQRWATVDKAIATKIKSGSSIGDYHNTHELFFQYCHKLVTVTHFFKTMFDYLNRHSTAKNCDFLSIGEQERIDPLIKQKSIILNQGFNKIVYIDDTGNERTVHEEDNKQEKRIFRMFHLPKVSHDDFISLLALSEKVTSVTGDQSFTENLLLGKIGDYECYGHKRTFYLGYIRLAESLKLQELVQYLKHHVVYLNEELPLDNIGKSIEKYDIQTVIKEFSIFRSHIIQHFNYTKLVVESVIRLLKYANEKSVKAQMLNRIDNRQLELSQLKTLKLHQLEETEFLAYLKSFITSGFSIHEAVNKTYGELHCKIDNATQPSMFGLFPNKFKLPSFVDEMIKAQRKENKMVSINANNTQMLDMLKAELLK